MADFSCSGWTSDEGKTRLYSLHQVKADGVSQWKFASISHLEVTEIQQYDVLGPIVKARLRHNDIGGHQVDLQVHDLLSFYHIHQTWRNTKQPSAKQIHWHFQGSNQSQKKETKTAALEQEITESFGYPDNVKKNAGEGDIFSSDTGDLCC